MGLDVVLGPPSGFLDWTPEQWGEFYGGAADLDGEKLGGYGAVNSTVQSICFNLEAGELGSRYPLFMRIAQIESSGWYHAELDSLLAEIQNLRAALALLPLDRVVLLGQDENGESVIYRPGPEEVASLSQEFQRAYPHHPLQNLADFNHYLLETLECQATRARAQGAGLLLA